MVRSRSSSRSLPRHTQLRAFPQRSPPRLLTDAACGGLKPPPAGDFGGPTSISGATSIRWADLLPRSLLQPSWHTVIGIPNQLAELATAVLPDPSGSTFGEAGRDSKILSQRARG